MPKVKKDPDVLTKDEARNMLAVHDGKVHTFYNGAFGLLGAEHDIKSIHQNIDEAFMLKRTGEQAQRMGHGLAIIPHENCAHSDILFVETKVKKAGA